MSKKEPKPAPAETTGEDGETPVPAKKKLAGKTLVLFVVLPAVLVLGGGGAAAMMLLGGGDKDAGEVHAEADEAHGEKSADDKHAAKDSGKGKGKSDDGHGTAKSTEAESNGAVVQVGASGAPSFYTLPNIIVSVNAGNGARSQLLLKLTLESGNPDVFKKLDAYLPRISDQFQVFLRELRLDDLSGSAADYRIRRELLRRVNLAIHPDVVDAVLIEEFIIQ